MERNLAEELAAREPIFHRPEWGTARADFERMTLEDFWEVGASGRIYSRDFVLAELERRYANGAYHDVWETRDLQCRELAVDICLVTYTLIQDKTRWTRRATVWKRVGEDWKIAYHQGTLMEDGPGRT